MGPDVRSFLTDGTGDGLRHEDHRPVFGAVDRRIDERQLEKHILTSVVDVDRGIPRGELGTHGSVLIAFERSDTKKHQSLVGSGAGRLVGDDDVIREELRSIERKCFAVVDGRGEDSGDVPGDHLLQNAPESRYHEIDQKKHDDGQEHTQRGGRHEDATVGNSRHAHREYLVVVGHAVHDDRRRKSGSEGKRELKHGNGGEEGVLPDIQGVDLILDHRFDRRTERDHHHEDHGRQQHHLE